MAAIWTNWGKANAGAALLRGVTSGGASLPATWYLILYDNTYTPNADHDTVSDIGAAALDPANYSGNGISRASGSFTSTVNDTDDRGETNAASSLTIAASAALNNVKGFALCTANNITTANVVLMQDFAGGATSVGSGQNLTISLGQIRIS